MIRIIADSTCDLSKELTEKYQIQIIPLHILLGDEEYEDGKSITPEKIFSWSEEHKSTPKTSAPSMETTMEILGQYRSTTDELICFSISADMSTSANVMRMAAEALDMEERVTVIDSRNLSAGIGLLVIEAAILEQEGKSRKEITDYIEERKALVRSSFVVDTLTYLHRGGRCSGLAAMAGGMLKLHPKIIVENGKMHPGKKYRGKISSAITLYVKDLEEELKTAKKDRIFFVHADCDADVVESVYNQLKGLNYFSEILIMKAGCVISSHCGRGTLGVFFMQEK